MATFALHACIPFVFLGLVLCSLPQAQAETFPLSSAVPHSIPEPLRPKLQELAQQNADRLYDYLLLRTDEVQRVCRLSGARFDELELAAKGTVQQAIDEWLSSIAAEYATDPQGAAAQLLTMRIQGQIRTSGVVVFGDADVRRAMIKRNLIVADDGRVVEFRQGAPQIRGQVLILPDEPEENLREGRVVRRHPSRPPSLNLDPGEVTDISVWQATLDRLLTESQRADLNTLRMKRALVRGNENTQIGQMVSYLDNQLLLDSGQCERITELCVNFTLVDNNTRVDASTAARRALEALPNEELAELLSERQQARWRELQQQNKGPFDAFRSRTLPESRSELREGANR